MTPATEKFQPALPLRGVTVPSYGFGRIQPISTRTPLAGSDTRRCCTDTTCQEFQPALPLRGVTESSASLVCSCLLYTSDPQAHARGRDVPRREERPHARDREAQVRGRERVGLEALSGRDSAGGVAAPEGGLMRLSEKCARFLTVPCRCRYCDRNLVVP